MATLHYVTSYSQVEDELEDYHIAKDAFDKLTTQVADLEETITKDKDALTKAEEHLVLALAYQEKASTLDAKDLIEHGVPEEFKELEPYVQAVIDARAALEQAQTDLAANEDALEEAKAVLDEKEKELARMQTNYAVEQVQKEAEAGKNTQPVKADKVSYVISSDKSTSAPKTGDPGLLGYLAMAGASSLGLLGLRDKKKRRK